MNKNRETYNAILRRKYQNQVDHEFKGYIKEHFPYEYRKAVAETNRTMERKRIISIINEKILEYKEKSRHDKNKKKWGQKILAMHELLIELEEKHK